MASRRGKSPFPRGFPTLVKTANDPPPQNFAHEPGILRAAEIIANGTGPLGPVLFYDLKMIVHVASGKKYHATEWRNVPDYQGGFLLDGCVHAAAALRVVAGDAK